MAPIHHTLNYSIQAITGYYGDMVFQMLRLYVGQDEEKKQFAVKMLEVFNVYHFEVGLLQLPSPLFQSLSKNSQFCVFSPQPPNLLLSLWGAALPLNTQGINISS